MATANDGLGNPGYYGFAGLAPGDYFVVFDKSTADSGANLIPSPQDQGTDNAADSDADITTGITKVTTLVRGENDVTWDAGFYGPASIGNYVWNDADSDGIQDESEIGMNGVTVSLYTDADGDGVAEPGGDDGTAFQTTATTYDAVGKAGYYNFSNLTPGSYFVVFTNPAGYVLTQQDQGGDDATDSDADPVSGATVVTDLIVGEDDITWDAGLYLAAGIGNYVWTDTDLDGIQGPGESGINNVVVSLYKDTDNDGVAEPGGDDGASVAVTLTSDDTGGNPGYYSFTGLSAGSYFMVFTKPAGYTFTPGNQGNDNSADSDASPETGQKSFVANQQAGCGPAAVALGNIRSLESRRDSL